MTPKRIKLRWKIAAVALAAIAGGFWWLGKGKTESSATTFAARRGPLEITVLEGGSLQALESQEIKCEVRVGYQGIKILKIVEEGYSVTEDDIRTNKVLVELDSSELQERMVQQEIQFQSAAAALTDAQQGYDIQLNQNLSDIKAAEQKAKFARMDFEKLMGDQAAGEIVTQLNLEAEMVPEDTGSGESLESPGNTGTNLPTAVVSINNAPAELKTTTMQAVQVQIALPPGNEVVGRPVAQAPTPPPQPPRKEPPLEPPPAPEPAKSVAIDFSKYADVKVLGDGEAKQKLRKFEDDLQVAQKELGQATATREGTQRLFDKGFVTKTDLSRDEIAYENSRLKVQTAETAKDLYLKYDFVKSAEETLSKFVEATRELARAKRAAISKMAQARAKLKSCQGQYNVQSRHRKELDEQLEKCLIHATKPGLVVYGGGGEEMFYYGGEERIREGATVRERQAIITIPNLTKMSVKVKIHESYIKKVKKGQKVRITVDAFPDKKLTGEVSKVGVLPDSQNRWMNPDMKVYLTTITVDGTQDWVKPGMSAKVEVIVDQLADVIYVPIQAVTPSDGKHYCYIDQGGRQERREVEVGDFNDEFIEIKKGVSVGDKVCLRTPDGVEKPSESKNTEDKDKTPPKAAPPSAPAKVASNAR